MPDMVPITSALWRALRLFQIWRVLNEHRMQRMEELRDMDSQSVD